jgi:hypothetical protein
MDGIGTYIVDTKLFDRVGMNEAGINYIGGGGGGVRPKLVQTTQTGLCDIKCCELH